MRKKLIELLVSVPSAEVIFGKREGKRLTTAWRIADHLIANGVTVRERGRWEWYAALVNPYALCSNCGCGLNKTDALNFSYCPYCGADMRGEEDG